MDCASPALLTPITAISARASAAAEVGRPTRLALPLGRAARIAVILPSSPRRRVVVPAIGRVKTKGALSVLPVLGDVDPHPVRHDTLDASDR